MADNLKQDNQGHIKIEGDAPAASVPVESTGRGLFDFMGKKEETEKKPHDHQGGAIASEFDQKVHVSEPVGQHKDEEKKHGSLLEKLHRSGSSSSSSSSEEEVEEDGKKIRRKKEKKGLKEKIKEKVSGEKKENVDHETHVPVEKYDDPVHDQQEDDQKKGFLDKIKEKLPGGGHKKPEEVPPPPPPTAAAGAASAESTSPDGGDQAKEKKGFLEKIKEKLPGYHTKTEEEKEKEKKHMHHIKGQKRKSI